VSFSRSERLALCALLGEKGPDAPTLCEGWTTRDLAAHLVLREHRPDAAAGIVVGPLAAYTARVQHRIAQQHDYADLVAAIRRGPPRLSVFALPGVDERANAVEYFVHHEDVRRGSPGWEPRPLDPGTEDLLWRRLGMARFVLRGAPCGVTLEREGAAGSPASAAITAKRGAPAVTVTGTPGELTVWVAGRQRAAQVRIDGDEGCVTRLSQARWGL
jgi:uncharacterized protein (TIGR03085 family)